MLSEMCEIIAEMLKSRTYSGDFHQENVAWENEEKNKIVFFDLGSVGKGGKEIKRKPIDFTD